jgi:metal-sulfur cluster biosynthetic enzyme
MEVGAEFQVRIDSWDSLSRWERSELGKDLRRLGLSYGEVMDLIPVKKSTLATWCREVKPSDEQYQAIRERTGSREGIPVDTQWKRRLEIERIRAEARVQVRELIDQPIWVAGTILYWAEGAKTRNHLRLNSADPRALRLFIKWIREYLNPDARFTMQLHLHDGNDEQLAMRYWVGETGLKDANFHRTFIKPAGTGHRKNHLAHGICTVTLRKGSDSWHTAMEWIRTLANEFGLEIRPN